jgi:CBS domain containing-hemolysin-like protein
VTLEVWLGVAAVVLVLFAAVLAVAETAMTQLTRARASAMVEQGRRGADRVQRIVDNIERDLNGVYLAVNIVQTSQSAIVGLLAVKIFGGWGAFVGVLLNVAVLFALAEAAPKTWALQHPERAALLTAPLVEGVGKVLRWPARGLIGIANIVLPGKGLAKGPFVTEEELLAIAGEAVQNAVIEESELDLIESVIDFGDTVAREIMVPRTDMVMIASDRTVTDFVELAIDKGLSRIPVFGENADDVTGIVYLKDAMRTEREGGGTRSVTVLLRPANFVPETKHVSELLAEMQSRKNHISIVVDEYGGTAGLVTLEDLLEELVGEIEDEFDTDAPAMVHLADGDVVVNATLNVDDLSEDLDLELPEGNWDSIGGLVLGLLGRVPVPGDSVVADGARLVVERVDGRRISQVRIVLPERPDHEADEEPPA